MRFTRRGWSAVALVLAAVALAWAAGARALNAVAAPALAGLLLGVVLVWRAEPPTVDRDDIRPGFPGDSRTDRLHVEGSGLVTVTEDRPPGLGLPMLDAMVTPPHTFETDFELAERGVYALGSPRLFQRDPLGLVASRVDVEATTDVVVYPRRYSLAGRRALANLLADELETERQEFDRLREYVPGDPLRNVHWKSSAKHDEFLVMEFAPTQRTETVTIAADAARGAADEMAAVTASILELALEAGLDVELVLPTDRLPPGQGETHREHALRLLARVEAGDVPKSVHESADVSVRARPEATRLEVAERELHLSERGYGGASDPEGVTVP